MEADGSARHETGDVPPADPIGALHYEIRLKGHLGARWASSFEGMSLTNDSDGTTAIRGPVVDQAAMHGLLQKLRDIGIPLVSISQVDPAERHPCAIEGAP